ncbi:3-hydroxyacyl-CoA dehydrogenase [Pseudomonas aeruginosa]|uniref:3-hydroxyacyl-CoA dehydrogenase n=1 Tax=Pseudomonas aeruginosa TaxID=287 RepID=UPI0031B729EC
MSMNKVIGVIGAGTMGRGIVQLFAEAGYRVRLFDAFTGAAGKAIEYISEMVGKGVVKGRFSAEQGQRILSSIEVVVELSQLAGCAVVIEAVVEDLQVKRSLFAELEDIVGSDAILASNTSSLVMADIAAGCRVPQRVAGLHFFNPVPLMKVVEVIAAVRTSAQVVAALVEMVESTGHRAVVAQDLPGFLVNHAGRGLYTEGLRIVEEQVADVADVDRVLREAAGFRMGPFELLDLTGLDVSGKVMNSIYSQFLQEPRFRPSPLVPPRIAAGLFGRKSGEGWYRYDGASRIEPEAAPAPPLPGALTVWLAPECEQYDALVERIIAAGSARVMEHAGDAALQIVQPWGEDATSACLRLGLDLQRCVAVDPLGLPGGRVTLMQTVSTSSEARDAAHALFAANGTPVTVINDSPGFVLQRVLVTIVNIAADIAQRRIASVADIEDAVRLGLGYPRGPLAWGDQIGPRRVLQILRNLHQGTGDPRYRPSLWLVRRAEAGLSLLSEGPARGADAA